MRNRSFNERINNKDSPYQIGVVVQVICENLLSYQEVGTIIDLPVQYPNSVIIQFDNWLGKGEKTLYIKKDNLKIIESGGTDMAAVTGNYRVAVVRFVDGGNQGTNYSFALFDNDIEVDDLVLCDTQRGYNVAKVTEIIKQEDYSGVTITKEIICKVDFSNFEKRKEIRKRKEAIKKQMDKMVKQNQELVLYQMLAEKNPDMKAMLDEYAALSEV